VVVIKMKLHKIKLQPLWLSLSSSETTLCFVWEVVVSPLTHVLTKGPSDCLWDGLHRQYSVSEIIVG